MGSTSSQSCAVTALAGRTVLHIALIHITPTRHDGRVDFHTNDQITWESNIETVFDSVRYNFDVSGVGVTATSKIRPQLLSPGNHANLDWGEGPVITIEQKT